MSIIVNALADAGSAGQADGPRLSSLSPTEQIEALRTAKSLRDGFKENSGAELLKIIDGKTKQHAALEEKFLQTFDQMATSVREFYAKVNKVGNLWWARKSDLQPSIPHIAVKPRKYGKVGEFDAYSDLGGATEYADVRRIPHEHRHFLRKGCDGYYAKLGSLKKDHEVAVRVAGVRGTGLAAVGAGALGTYMYGKSRIKEVYNAEPTQLITERDKRDQVQAVTAGIVAANVATSPKEMAEKVRLWRLDPKNENAQAIVSLFQDQLKSNLPGISASLEIQLSDKLGSAQIDTASWNRTLETHLHDEDVLSGTVDLAIADAIINEAKVTDPEMFENMLLRTDPTDAIKEKSRNGAIRYVYSIAPKYIWDVILDRTTYPSATTMVEETARQLDARRKKVMDAEKPVKEASPSSRTEAKPFAETKDETAASGKKSDSSTAGSSLDDRLPPMAGEVSALDPTISSQASPLTDSSSMLTSAAER